MRQRIITAVVLLLAIVPAIISGGWIFDLVIGIICILGSIELLHMAKISRRLFPSFITYIGVLSIVFYDYIVMFIPDYLTSMFVPLLSIMLLLISTVLIHDYEFTKAGISALTMFYIGLGGYSAVTIRAADLALFMYILLVVFSTDIGAYFIGSLIGKNKLAPTLSPNKTVEGALGGIATAVVLAAIYLRYFTFTYSYGTMLVMAVILSITGQFGDLLESRLKRHFMVKDSGNILPGHGGILDRFDSVLFTLSMAFILGIF